jgi:4-amino-4-deoxy-L-arabinose transferase-like glycosyltransferase/Flp pilus assembly protein TadD
VIDGRGADVNDRFRMFRVVKHPLMVIVVIAAVIKVIVTLQLGDHPMLSEDGGLDTTAYAELARRIVAGDLLLGPGLYYLSPLYMYVLAAGLAVTDSFTSVRILQALLGAVSIGGLWAITSTWANTRAAMWAAALAVGTGVLTFYEALILQTSIDTALTTAALLALTWAVRSNQPRWFSLTGAAFGLATLNRPNMMVVAAGLVVIILLARRIRPAVLFLAGVALALAPVAIRNGVVAGEWFTVSSHGGLNLYIGNSPTATGFYQVVPGIRPSIAGQAHDVREVAGRAMGRVVTDEEASDYFVDLALTWVRTNPVDALSLFAKKFVFVFHGQQVPLPYSYPFYVEETDAWLRYLPVGSWLLMPLGLVGLGVLARRHHNREDVLIWLAFVPLYAGSVALFFVADRYRLPLLVPMCVGAGVALDALAGAIRARAWSGILLPSTAGLLLFALVNTPAELTDGRWVEGAKLAQRLAILGHDDEAREWVERLAPDAREPGLAHHLVGGQYLVEGRPERALPYLQAAFDAGLRHPQAARDLATALERTGDRARAASVLNGITPSTAEAAAFWLGLGRLASTLRDPALAERFFRQAVTQVPEDPDARLQYGVNLVVQNRLDEAAAQLRAAVSIDPRQPDALAYLAFCELSLGNVADARRFVNTALAIDPSHAIALSVLAAMPR